MNAKCTRAPLLTANTTPEHRWCQVSLKTLFAIIMVAAVSFGVVASPAERQRTSVRKVVALGGRVEYADRSDEESWLAHWCRKWLPRDYFDPVIEVDLNNAYSVTDKDLQILLALPKLERIGLSHSKVTDSGLIYLHGLRKLTWAYLYDTEVTDMGAAKLRLVLPNCEIVLH